MEITAKCSIGKLDEPNSRGYIFKSKNMQKALDEWNEYGKKVVELGHNTDMNADDARSTTLENICGQIKDIKIKDDEIIANIELYDTERGRIVQSMVEFGYNFVICPRIIASTPVPVTDFMGNQKKDKDGQPIYEIKDIEIIAFDLDSRFK